MNRRFHRLRFLLIGAVIGVVTMTARSPTLTADPTTVAKPGRILIIRGILTVFSLGLDGLAAKLSDRGYRVDITSPAMALIAAESIEQDYFDDPSTGPLVVIGHSMGGRYCCAIPWRWREMGIPIKLSVILDANPLTPVPDNVQRCVNLYVTNNLGIFHGQDVWAVDPRTDVVNLDMTRVSRPPGVPAIDHFNIDDSTWVHELVIEEVDRSLARAAGGTVPLTRVTPAKPRVWSEAEQATDRSRGG